jgi:CspA family cold shock protein
MRLSGTVKFFNSAKGFGFITPDEGGKDVFVHATAVEAAGMRALNEGDRVSFELGDDRKGRGAGRKTLGRRSPTKVHALA